MKKSFIIGISAIIMFVLWTAAISLIDVQAIGPNGSSVGFAAFNRAIHELTGVNMVLYILTDWLGLIPVCFAFGFAVLGLVQLIKRRSFFKVDADILLLGVFYIVVIAAYLFFECYAVNYRPVLIDGFLEASYPSSTTLLVLCVMPTAVIQLNKRIKRRTFRTVSAVIINLFTVFMVMGRFISGVHWATDIIGGIILSAGLVIIYYGLFSVCNKKIKPQV